MVPAIVTIDVYILFTLQMCAAVEKGLKSQCSMC